jgi:hypothetical protein
MRAQNTVYALILGVGAVLAPTIVEAQNYDIFPGFHDTRGPGPIDYYHWDSEIVSLKNSKVYHCEVFLDQPLTNLSLTCTLLPGWKGTLLNGPNVVTIQPRNIVGIPRVAVDIANIWQLDRNTGELQFCYVNAASLPNDCISTKLP